MLSCAGIILYGIIYQKNEILYNHPEEKSCICKMSIMRSGWYHLQVPFPELEGKMDKESIFSEALPM